MITIRPSASRGHFDHGWLDTFHTFSFGHYQDDAHMSYGPLRVINEDVVQPAQGFGKHPHRDMEIITYVVSGALQHEDSTGGSDVIRPGDVQHMTAGRGVFHSEFNASKKEPVHLLQIWIMPSDPGLPPAYHQEHFAEAERRNRLRLVASPDGAEGSVPIRQDARMYASLLDSGKTVSLELGKGRRAWAQLIKGEVSLNGQGLSPGDGAAVEGEPRLTIAASKDAELLVFDLP